MKNGQLEKSDINPVVSDMSYAEITEIFGKQASHIAKLMGVKKAKKTTKKGEE